MSKITAVIQLGWLTRRYEAEDPCGIIRAVEVEQDMECLLRMGRMQEGKKGQKELDKLEAFLEKYYDGSLTLEDIKGLDLKLSIGDIACLEAHEISEDT